MEIYDFDMENLQKYINLVRLLLYFDKSSRVFLYKLKQKLLDYITLEAVRYICLTTLTKNASITKTKLKTTIQRIFNLNVSLQVIAKKYMFMNRKVMKNDKIFDCHETISKILKYYESEKPILDNMIQYFYNNYNFIKKENDVIFYRKHKNIQKI